MQAVLRSNTTKVLLTKIWIPIVCILTACGTGFPTLWSFLLAIPFLIAALFGLFVAVVEVRGGAIRYRRLFKWKTINLAAGLQCMIVFFGMGFLHGLVPILTSETFPTRFRYSGTGISYGLSGILAGMIAPPLPARLIGQDVVRHWYYLPIIYAVYGAAAMSALIFIRETPDVRLEELDRTGV